MSPNPQFVARLLLGASCLSALATRNATTLDYPSRRITVVVPHSAGGPTDASRGLNTRKNTMSRSLRSLTFLLVLLAVVWAPSAHAQLIVSELEQEVRLRAAQVESKLITWRRDIHEHPELGEQETRTAGLIAAHLAGLGLQVRTGIAGSGVVAILKGGKPGPVVALRAELDALPLKEPNHLPFASKAKGQYLGREVDVMHACGHDAHAAILMATAEVLTAMKDKLPGAVKFIFQPAEEGPSLYAAANDKVWGAKLMIKEGVLQDPRPDVLFALHAVSTLPAGRLAYRGGPALAGGDELRIRVTGRQGNAGIPWRTIDPVVTAAQIVLGLQTIVSRRTDLIKSPAVVSVATINGGSRSNIMPATVDMTGTIRTYDGGVRAGIHRDVRQIAEGIAASANATAEVEIINMVDPTVNDERITARMAPVLERAANGDAILDERTVAGDDIGAMLAEVPGLDFHLGIVPRDQDVAKAAPNHSPDFFVDESALIVGLRALAMVTVNYLAAPGADLRR
jgi:amidohydrolase